MNQYVYPQSNFPVWHRSSSEEFVNAATHGFGFLLAVAGALAMMAGVAAHRDAGLMISCTLYLGSLVSVYAMSTLSHSATSLQWKSWFRQLDQACIYLLIVGTYTPISVAYLRGGFWWVLLGIMWMAAIAGFVAKVFYAHRVDVVSVTSYVVLGWLPVVGIPMLWRVAPSGVFDSVIAGGLCYMVGTLFLVYDERVRHFHAAWHLLVIAGSVCHFLGIYLFIVRGGI